MECPLCLHNKSNKEQFCILSRELQAAVCECPRKSSQQGRAAQPASHTSIVVK